MDEDCVRLTSYFSERQRADRGSLADLSARREIAASIVLRGTEGSATVIAVGTRPDIETLLGEAAELAHPGLVTVEHARLLTGDIDPVWLGEQHDEATRLTVYCGRHDRAYQVPAFEAVCELLYRRGIAGATVVPGIDGTLRGQRQHPQFLRHDGDTPLLIIAVGSGSEIGMILPELGALFRHPVMTVEKVQVCKRDGQLISRPQVFADGEPGGKTARLTLTVYVSEAARHDGQPVHRALARQLRQTGIESVTTVRGIWGFHADHVPHGGHFPRPDRHVPTITTMTGTAEGVSAAFDAVTLAAGGGLVTAQAVLATQPLADALPAARADLCSRRMRRWGSPITADTAANGPCPVDGRRPVASSDYDAYRHAISSIVAKCAYCCREGDRPGWAMESGDLAPGWLAHLYSCWGLSTYQIATISGVDRQRVTRALHRAGVPLRPRGAGRLRPVRRTDDPPDLPLLLPELYQEARLGSPQIAAILGLPERTVRDRLRRYGIKMRNRGGWSREDRLTVPASLLDALYVEFGMTAAEVGQRLGVSGGTILRSAHALGVAVRAGGAVPLPGREEIRLVSALYADPLVTATLTAHDVPRVPAGGSLTQRFPVPVPLTAPLVKDLYWGCGTGLNHVELLTGQAAETIRGFMRRSEIPLRPPGGRTPFMRRWRSGLAVASRRRPSG